MPHPTRPALHQNLKTWGLVAGLLATATLGGIALDQRISLTSEAMLYVMAVVLASYALAPLPSVVCAVGAVTAFNFFFVPPRFTFAVDSQEHLIALLAMLVVALTISHLAARLRRETVLASQSAQRALQLQALASALASATTAQAVAALGQSALDERYDGPNTLAILRPNGTLDGGLATLGKLQDGLRSCIHEAAPLGPGTGRWPGLNAWYLPMGNAGQIEGAVCIENISAADSVGREHAQALCALLAHSLSRIKMADAMQASQAEVQRQQIQSTFLAAISHDLRTPLAAVVGAASALQSQGDKLGAPERARLLGSIASEAAYLSTLTENTLQLVQLAQWGQHGAPLQRGWESMEEIVGAVLGRMRLRDPNHRISVQVPQHLPLIEVDPVLLAQLLSNLLDNALQYSPGPIALQVQAMPADCPTRMLVRVKDRGAAIGAELREQIFQPYARGDQGGQRGARGAGLGLALCRAIATVHGGSLTLSQRAQGGNCFALSLPINPQQPAGDLP